MKAIDPLLTDADLASALANGAGTTDAPGLGSGLFYLGGCDFGMVTDRGPNGDRADGSKFFPMPAFTPTITTVSGSGSALVLASVLPILDEAGSPVTGLSNGPADDPPYPTATATEPLAYVQAGLDPEDVHRLPSGDWMLVEEYSPSLVIVDGLSGKVKVRYVPAGVSLPSAGYPVKPILPGILASRRPNKGLEGLAVSPDGHTAYLVVQTPLGDESQTGKSLVNRVVRVDDADSPDSAHVGAHWLALHSPSSAYPGNKQTKIYFNAAAWLGTDRVLLLERGDGLMRLVAADFSTATNLVGHPELGEDDLAPEAVSTPPGYEKIGIVPATMTEVFTSADTPEILVTPPVGAVVPGKLEGLAILDATTVAITNDNDFGITNADDTSRIWVLRLEAALP